MNLQSRLQNRVVRLVARPVGEANRSDFSFTDEPVPALEDGQILIRTLFLSLDPAMRGWMNEGKSYIPPVGLGEVMRAGGVGEVIASNNPKFAVGDKVSGMINVQTHCVTDGRGFTKIDPALAPLTTYLNVLGMPGMTAYFGLLEAGQPKAGENSRRLGRDGRCGRYSGPGGQNKGLPGGRNSRRQGKMRLRGE